MKVFLVNPSDVSFGIAVITPRWLFVLAAATPARFGDPELVANFPAYPAQLRSLESSRPRPRTPLWNEIENAFGIYLSKANSGELSAEDAMNQANSEIAKILERGK